MISITDGLSNKQVMILRGMGGVLGGRGKPVPDYVDCKAVGKKEKLCTR